MPAGFKPNKFFSKHWFAVEVIPIYVTVVGAVGGAAWYLSRLARGTEVVWDKKNNPHPWQHVKENQQVKLFAVNHKYDGEPWSRDRL